LTGDIAIRLVEGAEVERREGEEALVGRIASERGATIEREREREKTKKREAEVKPKGGKRRDQQKQKRDSRVEPVFEVEGSEEEEAEEELGGLASC
jgi:hypothetical protein